MFSLLKFMPDIKLICPFFLSRTVDKKMFYPEMILFFPFFLMVCLTLSVLFMEMPGNILVGVCMWFFPMAFGAFLALVD